MIVQYSFEEPIQVVTLYKAIYSSITLREVGVLAVNLDAGYIEKQLDTLRMAEGQRLLVVSDDGELLYQNRSLLPADEGLSVKDLIGDRAYAVGDFRNRNSAFKIDIETFPIWCYDEYHNKALKRGVKCQV